MDISQENQKTETVKHGNVMTISWQADEFTFHPKTTSWYLIFWLIFGVLIGFSIFLKNILMIILFSIFTIILYFYSKRTPRLMNYEINALGLKIDDNFYPYEKIDSFWILYHPPHIKELVIKNKRSFMPYLRIQLEDADPNEIREELLNYLEEEPYEENFIETLARIIKF